MTAEVSHALEAVKVDQLMLKNITLVPHDKTITEFINEYASVSKQQVYPVAEKGKINGMVITKKAEKIPLKQRGLYRIGDIMRNISTLECASPDETALELLKKLQKLGTKYLPVKENGDVLGLVGRSDIFRWIKLNTDMAVYRKR
jgi:predicted transcriptional regulator